MSVAIKISLNDGLYLREPQDSKLGRKIIEFSILLIEEYGFEAFTFKKLAKRIESTEASIYRYFENKHMLFLFLVNWYWEWTSYLISVNTLNVKDPSEKLRIIIHSLVSASKENPSVAYVNENLLQKIVNSEGLKAYRTKGVDEENAKGFFSSYKHLTNLIAQVILEVNPDFKYPNALASNLFEMSNDHVYFAQHLPKLTEVSDSKNLEVEVEELMIYFTERLLRD